MYNFDLHPPIYFVFNDLYCKYLCYPAYWVQTMIKQIIVQAITKKIKVYMKHLSRIKATSFHE